MRALSACHQNLVLITNDIDGNPMLRNGVTGDWIGTFLGHKGAIWCSRLTTDGAWAVTGSADFSANIWNGKTGQLVASLPHNHIVRTCDFAPGSSQYSNSERKETEGSAKDETEDLRVVTGGQDKTVRIWNVPNQKVEIEWSIGESPIRSILWISPSVIVTVTFDGVVTWWDISQQTPAKINEMELKATTGQVERYSSDCLVVAAGSSAYLIEAPSGKLINKVDLDYEVSALAINADKTQFLSGCSDDTWVRLHDFETGELLDTYKGHHGPVHSIAYSPDGCVCATGSEDGTIRLWKMTPEPYGLWAS